MLNDMYQRGSETSKIIEDLMNIVNWSCKLKIDKNLINDEFNTEEDNQFALSYPIRSRKVKFLAKFNEGL